jgi:RNA polymerase sigma factor (sigma-70 family)
MITIRISGEERVQMTKEEVIKQFDGMIKKFATSCTIEIPQSTNNNYEREDYISIGQLTLLEALETYNVEMASFSTYLTNKLRGAKTNMLIALGSQKRDDRGFGTVSLNATGDEGEEVSEVIGNIDEDFEDMEMAMDIRVLLSALTDEEKLIFNFLYQENQTKMEFAKKLGIQRSTLDRRIVKLQTKLQGLYSL